MQVLKISVAPYRPRGRRVHPNERPSHRNKKKKKNKNKNKKTNTNKDTTTIINSSNNSENIDSSVTWVSLESTILCCFIL
jgi:hypothetical protein